ncbi:MAG TPA: MucB/RseB C-terminal domain-containing protein [Methylibium sp.]|uniref:MucB/RseB C-terminal domain-containing protein n=1 Tax=Methylibium sp. TaxID=2067992 RepID=UPI002DBC73D9|nr:MucB/RseB C-terminal domain-containing protein [Methylibium sp.]HEU4458661.1 MucB/RseB C-terminal domain-containing protein [Methylibium sp.]
MWRGLLAVAGRSVAPTVLLAAMVWPVVAHAQPTESSLDAREAQQWLARIHEAARLRNYQGTFVVTTGASVASSRIQHFCDGPNQYEKIESLDGQMRQVFRHNEVVHSLWPQKRLAVVETRQVAGEFPALLSAGAERIAQQYEIKSRGAGRVAGHEAYVLALLPKDGYRYGYRLWAEKASGLLLRAEVVDEHDAVLEVSAFSDLTLNVKPRPDLVTQPMKRLDGYAVQRPSLEPVDLAAQGWTVRQVPPGFKHVASVRRSFEAAAQADVAPQPVVLQTIYSDGLTHVSIFIEPSAPGRQRQEAMLALGATQTLIRRRGDHWLTVIGDVPAQTLLAFAAAMELRR